MTTTLRNLAFQQYDTSNFSATTRPWPHSVNRSWPWEQDMILGVIDGMTKSTYSTERTFKDASRDYLVGWALSTPFELLNAQYDKLKIAHPDFLGDNIENSDRAFKIVANDLLDLFKSISIDITNTPSLSFRTRNFQNHDVSYEVFVDDAELFVGYSIYKNKELYVRNMGPHEEMLKEIVRILKPYRESTLPLLQGSRYLDCTF